MAPGSFATRFDRCARACPRDGLLQPTPPRQRTRRRAPRASDGAGWRSDVIAFRSIAWRSRLHDHTRAGRRAPPAPTARAAVGRHTGSERRRTGPAGRDRLVAEGEALRRHRAWGSSDRTTEDTAVRHGLSTSSVWFIRVWWWTSLASTDSRVALTLALIFGAAWLVVLVAHARLLYLRG